MGKKLVDKLAEQVLGIMDQNETGHFFNPKIGVRNFVVTLGLFAANSAGLLDWVPGADLPIRIFGPPALGFYAKDVVAYFVMGYR
ncbi:MAG: hypothetical protein ACE5ES_02830 [Candidatus Nanoarchaeia archaeon]